MFLKDVERLVAKSNDKNFIYPLYDGYSLPNVMNYVLENFKIKSNGKSLDRSITKNLHFKNISKIVVILVDGLGYEMFKKNYKKCEFLDNFVKNGIVAPITAGFPSTTAAAVTTMYTGLTPQEHAIHEWTVYFKEIGLVINTLPFTSVYDDSQLAGKFNSIILYKGHKFSDSLKKKVRMHIVLDKKLEKSAYNSLFRDDCNNIGYVENSDMAIELRRALQKEKHMAYFYVYISSVDSVTHIYGPDTEESDAEIYAMARSLQNGLQKIDKKTAEGTLVILTADHGHTKLDPRRVIYLNNDKKLSSWYARDSKNKIIPPTGSSRDVFFHIKEDKLEMAYKHLSKRFGKTAKIIKIRDAIKMGLFGRGKLNKKFVDRTGNLLLLPYANKGIWYEFVKDKKSPYKGMHGGLSRKEMLIPFAAARLSDVI